MTEITSFSLSGSQYSYKGVLTLLYILYIVYCALILDVCLMIDKLSLISFISR